MDWEVVLVEISADGVCMWQPVDVCGALCDGPQFAVTGGVVMLAAASHMCVTTLVPLRCGFRMASRCVVSSVVTIRD